MANAAAGLAPGFLIIPSMALRHGVVQEPLVPKATAPGEASPEAQARALRLAGATWVQVVDVDAAVGDRNQWPQLTRLLGDGSLLVQFGGGIRSMTQVQQLLDLGVERVIVGTQAIRHPLWAKELAHIFRGRIVLALDARGRKLVVQGQAEEVEADLVATARALDGIGLAAMLYTAVGEGPDWSLVAELRLQAPLTPLLVGGPLGLDDLDRLAAMGAAGAVLGLGGLGAADNLAQALRRHPPPALPPMLQVLRAREDLEGALADGVGDPEAEGEGLEAELGEDDVEGSA